MQELRDRIFPLKKARDVKSRITSTSKSNVPLSSPTIARTPTIPTIRKPNLRRPKVVVSKNDKDKIEQKDCLGTSSAREPSTKSPIVYRKQVFIYITQYLHNFLRWFN